VQLSAEDPTAQVQGTRTGFKVEGHFEYSDDKQPYEASLTGEYSMAFATYYAELRLDARLCDKLFVGPAVEADGDTGYDGQRRGGYAKYTFDIIKSMPLEATLVAGHSSSRARATVAVPPASAAAPAPTAPSSSTPTSRLAAAGSASSSRAVHQQKRSR
jgi:hypothetical protein